MVLPRNSQGRALVRTNMRNTGPVTSVMSWAHNESISVQSVPMSSNGRAAIWMLSEKMVSNVAMSTARMWLNNRKMDISRTFRMTITISQK